MKKTFLFLALSVVSSIAVEAQMSNRNNRLFPNNNGWQNGNSNWQNNSNDPCNNPNNGYGWQSNPRLGRCNGNCACGGRAVYYEAMPEADFSAALQELKAQSFDDDKLQMAKYILSNTYTSTRQVIAMAKLFSFSDSKREFLIAAYPNCLDKSLYFRAVNTLPFSTDKAQVWAAIESMRRQ